MREETDKEQVLRPLFYSNRNPNPVFTLSLEGKIVYSNPAGKEVLHHSQTGLDDSMATENFTLVAAAAYKNSKIIKESLPYKNAYIVFTFVPRAGSGLVDVFGTDISEEAGHRHFFEIISAFSTALLSAQTEDDVARIIVEEAVEHLSYADCVVYLIDRATGELVQRAAYGSKTLGAKGRKIPSPIRLRQGSGIAGRAAMLRRTIIVDDLSKEDSYVVDDKARLSEIAVPIIANGQVIGVIDSAHDQKGYFSSEDQKILESIASIAATGLLRSQAIENIRHTEEKYRHLIENVFGGIYILRDDRFVFVNERFAEMTGFSVAELTSESFDSAAIIHRLDEKAKKAIESRTKGDFSPKSYELEIKTKQGEIRNLAINTSISEDEKGYYALGIALDITDTLKSKRELEEVIESLEERTSELNEFAHLASHNLRSPVTNLLGLLEHYNHYDPTDPLNTEIVKKFELSAKQLNLTLEEMHKVLHIRAEKNFDYRTVDLEDVLHDIKAQVGEKMIKSRIRIETDFRILKLKYVRSHIENLFLNLVTNAIKYAKEGEDPHLKISSRRENGNIVLTFTDKGIGIDLKRHGNELFGMYKRFHNHPESRGLGLYLIKKQLQALGSDIRVESTPGLGTTFLITLSSK